MNKKQILSMAIACQVTSEILEIVLNEYPQIITKAIIKVVEKNPEIFKEKE